LRRAGGLAVVAAFAGACIGFGAGSARAVPALAISDSLVAATSAPGTGAGAAGREGFVSKRDLTRLVFASALVAIVSHDDLEITRRLTPVHGSFAHGLDRAGEHFGNPVYSAPALAALWAYGKLDDRPGLSRSALRIGGGVLAASIVSGGVKEVVGRWRPKESPDDPSRTGAFDGHNSFPSGHATVAFALASGIDHETRARWVPWVVYPLAGLTGWSRMHDREHWASDIAAGAVIGLWSTEKFRLEWATVSGSHRPAPAITVHF
jgi:hypothetical protein